jgi:nitrate reductase alpha subunit
MIKQISDLSKNIVLYSKNWYKKSDNHIQDLKTLVSKLCALDIKYISDCDIYNEVADTFVEVCNQRDYRRLLQDFFYKPLANPEPLLMPEAIDRMLGLIGCIQVKTDMELLIDLGKPDYNLLPKVEHKEN